MPWQGQTNDFMGLIWPVGWTFPTSVLGDLLRKVKSSIQQVSSNLRKETNLWKGKEWRKPQSPPSPLQCRKD